MIDIYAGTSNEERAQEINKPTRKAPARERAPGLSVIILNLNKPELIIPLAGHLAKEHDLFSRAGLHLEVIIGDTGSSDPRVLELLDSPPTPIRVVRNLQYHFSKNNNDLAFEHALNRDFLFLNNDVIFTSAGQLLSFYETFLSAKREDIFGTILLFEDDSIQHAGVFFSRHQQSHALPYHDGATEKLSLSLFPKLKEVPAVTGACLMISSELFFKVGGFDEEYAAECQDIELCLVADRLGVRSKLCNLGIIRHLENATRPKGEVHENDRRRFLRHWRSYIEVRFL